MYVLLKSQCWCQSESKSSFFNFTWKPRLIKFDISSTVASWFLRGNNLLGFKVIYKLKNEPFCFPVAWLCVCYYSNSQYIFLDVFLQLSVKKRNIIIQCLCWIILLLPLSALCRIQKDSHSIQPLSVYLMFFLSALKMLFTIGETICYVK